jgi:hypothetical protein
MEQRMLDIDPTLKPIADAIQKVQSDGCSSALIVYCYPGALDRFFLPRTNGADSQKATTFYSINGVPLRERLWMPKDSYMIVQESLRESKVVSMGRVSA